MSPQPQPHHLPSSPRESIHLYTQPPDTHRSVAHKKVSRWDLSDDTLCKVETITVTVVTATLPQTVSSWNPNYPQTCKITVWTKRHHKCAAILNILIVHSLWLYTFKRLGGDWIAEMRIVLTQIYACEFHCCFDMWNFVPCLLSLFLNTKVFQSSL